MKKLCILPLFIFLLTTIYAQQDSTKTNYKLGIGSSFTGDGDMISLSFENELSYRINRYFTGSVSAVYGKSNTGAYISSSYLQGNVNVFLSPFKNIKRNDFKIGGGVSFMNRTEVFRASDRYIDGVLDKGNYGYNIDNSYGYNLIIEDEYKISDNYLIGLKIISQSYFNGYYSIGGFLKLGILLK